MRSKSHLRVATLRFVGAMKLRTSCLQNLHSAVLDGLFQCFIKSLHGLPHGYGDKGNGGRDGDGDEGLRVLLDGIAK